MTVPQHNFESTSSMTQKEVILGTVHLETIEKRYRDFVWQSNKGDSGRVAIEGSLIVNLKIPLHETCATFTQEKVVKYHLESESKMCNSPNNRITRTGH